MFFSQRRGQQAFGVLSSEQRNSNVVCKARTAEEYVRKLLGIRELRAFTLVLPSEHRVDLFPGHILFVLNTTDFLSEDIAKLRLVLDLPMQTPPNHRVVKPSLVLSALQVLLIRKRRILGKLAVLLQTEGGVRRLLAPPQPLSTFGTEASCYLNLWDPDTGFLSHCREIPIST
mmetsp:Transcript_32963/g.64682  ORF Transcript_32963/g.64682 Transcript_32963/m.64682 type:complete len:173 (+) Transcript_32963:104-622(+)